MKIIAGLIFSFIGNQIGSQNLNAGNLQGHMVEQNIIESIASTAASVVISVIETSKSIANFVIDAIFVILQQVNETLSIIIE